MDPFRFLLLAILIAVGLILYLLFLRTAGRKTDQEQPSRIIDPGKRIKPPPEHTIISDLERKTLLETTPDLKEIRYTSLSNAALPTFTHTLEEGLMSRIQEKLAAERVIQLDHLKLLNLLRDMGSSPGEISDLILTNPDLSAKILQTVNSAYFGFSKKIISAGWAITLLGYSHVRSLVLQDYLNALVPNLWQEDNKTFLKIWIHSACVAVCAGHLSRQIFKMDEYDFGAIGLLHDIGKYFLPSLDIRGEAVPDQPSIIQEEQRYKINHALMGSIIAEKWELSDLILNGIKYHHHPFFFSPETIPEPFAKPAFVMAISDLITRVLGYPGNETDLFPISDDYYRKYNLNPDLKKIISPFLIKEMDKARKTVLSYSQIPMEGEK